jgi:hypothetical protein
VPCDYITQYVWDPKFTPGQKWSYHARSTDAGSTVTIAEIDDVPSIGPVVHILVNHVGSGGVELGGERFAIKRDSLDASVIDIVDHVRIPELGYPYRTYRAHCIALTYATTVADTLTAFAIQRCEQALKRDPKHPPLPCKPAPRQPPAPVPGNIAPQPATPQPSMSR